MSMAYPGNAESTATAWNSNSETFPGNERPANHRNSRVINREITFPEESPVQTECNVKGTYFENFSLNGRCTS